MQNQYSQTLATFTQHVLPRLSGALSLAAAAFIEAANTTGTNNLSYSHYAKLTGNINSRPTRPYPEWAEPPPVPNVRWESNFYIGFGPPPPVWVGGVESPTL